MPDNDTKPQLAYRRVDLVGYPKLFAGVLHNWGNGRVMCVADPWEQVVNHLQKVTWFIPPSLIVVQITGESTVLVAYAEKGLRADAVMLCDDAQ